MNKRIQIIVYALALLATLLISLFSLPVYLVWALRIGVVAAAAVGVYLFSRNKYDYRYRAKEDGGQK